MSRTCKAGTSQLSLLQVLSPFPVELMSQIVNAAAFDLSVSTGVPSGNYAHQEKPVNQQLYLATFAQFLPQLQGASYTTVQEAFAEQLYFTIDQATYSGNLSPDVVASLSALTHSAGFDGAIAAGFLLVSPVCFMQNLFFKAAVFNVQMPAICAFCQQTLMRIICSTFQHLLFQPHPTPLAITTAAVAPP